ncbi:MAG: hypothetical protein F6K65_14625 [Moorea sp. SIO3C2]|nr:hypothetical protein [Moorena sp. SIO3C2]
MPKIKNVPHQVYVRWAVHQTDLPSLPIPLLGTPHPKINDCIQSPYSRLPLL